MTVIRKPCIFCGAFTEHRCESCADPHPCCEDKGACFARVEAREKRLRDEGKRRVRPDGPETDRGGLIGQQPE